MKKTLILKTMSVVIDSVVVSVDFAVDWRKFKLWRVNDGV